MSKAESRRFLVTASVSGAVATSQLDSRVQSFLELIGNINMLSTTLKSLDIDVQKMPLGAISSEQLGKAEKVLQEIRTLLSVSNSNNANPSTVDPTAA